MDTIIVHTDYKPDPRLKVVFKKKISGFTLLELTIVVAILITLAAIALPNVFSILPRARMAADEATVKTLNTVTLLARANISPDPFKLTTNSDQDLLQVLVDNQYLTSMVKPQTKNTKFSWIFLDQRWDLFDDSAYSVGILDGLRFKNWNGQGLPGILEGSGSGYLGQFKNIVIPKAIEDIDITEIYQDTFDGKALVSLDFDPNSKITQIHARAFRNNKLTKVVFPPSLTRIDTYSFAKNELTQITLPPNLTLIESHAFKNNKLTEITLPPKLERIHGYVFEENPDLNKITIEAEKVTIGTKAFGNYTESFIAAYDQGGKGTYLLINNDWVRQP